ncbi:uncharacterized protein K02A2.6-like [Anneissia japonica]|uniref:uncharacterized protein K02A2.6-like n=1 Tax=Anneissia japonica TaxID=1529436 RepID=UPI001425620C|nr:uncharacterized protein K02A2.6-like [Anneissia japonica]
MGSNRLLVVDAYSKYPCIHPTTSTSTSATIKLLEEDCAHFGYPHTLVSDNATTFTSDEFQLWCTERGIVHLTGALYHPATNGAAERLVQSFKQALRKSTHPPGVALKEFLIQYRRTPLPTGFSYSELLNGRQIRTKIDTVLPSPAHIAQGKQNVKSLVREYKIGDTCYALYCGPRRDKNPRLVPAVVTKRLGPRSVNVKVVPKGPVWRRHIEQLQPRYETKEDADPGVDYQHDSLLDNNYPAVEQAMMDTNVNAPKPSINHDKHYRVHNDNREQYGPQNPRRSSRARKSKMMFSY